MEQRIVGWRCDTCRFQLDVTVYADHGRTDLLAAAIAHAEKVKPDVCAPGGCFRGRGRSECDMRQGGVVRFGEHPRVPFPAPAPVLADGG